MDNPLSELMHDGFAAPLGDVIAAIGRGVAEAQAALDRAALEATLNLYESDGDAGTALLREIGYRPTFYALPETSCEVQLSMRVGGGGTSSGTADGGAPANGRLLAARTYVTPVDATFANRFNYEAAASARLSFKIVPIPPPSALDDQRPVPALTGRSVGEAELALTRLGLTASYQDGSGKALTEAPKATDVVLAQSPDALTLARIGGAVLLTVAP